MSFWYRACQGKKKPEQGGQLANANRLTEHLGVNKHRIINFHKLQKVIQQSLAVVITIIIVIINHNNCILSVHIQRTLRKTSHSVDKMSKLRCCIRAHWNVNVIHFFWHLPSKILQISIVISFSKPVWDYRLHLHDVWCLCFYAIKRLTFKWVQLLMLEGREWYFLPALT